MFSLVEICANINMRNFIIICYKIVFLFFKNVHRGIVMVYLKRKIKEPVNKVALPISISQ